MPSRPNSLVLLALVATAASLGCGAPASSTRVNEPPPPDESAAASFAPSSVPAAPPASVSAAPPAGPADQPAPSDAANPPADAEKTASGLKSKVLAPGSGKVHPGPRSKVTVSYTGWTQAGKMVDTSINGEPLTFGLDQVIKGWGEGLPLMVEGEKRRLWIPAALAYGDHPHAGTPSGDLVFDVELLEIVAPPKAPDVPEDVKAAPASAKRTPSGLAYHVLKKGTGTVHPTATSKVRVHYTGWTPDGKMFDSSIMRGESITFALNNVIRGWTEGVALMTAGEKTRFWIPSALAYGDVPKRPGTPAGMLVFDVELLGIE